MADPVIRCSILSPEKAVFEEVCETVVVPLHDGELGVHAHHAPLLGKLGHGELRATRLGTTHRFYVGGGFVEVCDDAVTVLSDLAQPADEIDREEAERDLATARERPALGDEEIARRQHDVDVARARLRVARARRGD